MTAQVFWTSTKNQCPKAFVLLGWHASLKRRKGTFQPLGKTLCYVRVTRLISQLLFETVNEKFTMPA
jgi:hypothetical protein